MNGYLFFILMISFLLEGVFSCFVSMNSIFLPLFTLVSLCMVYPYFKKYTNMFYKIVVILGFCYDLIYTNTIFIHAILFLIIGYWITLLYRFFSGHIYSFFILILLVIVGYRFLSFLLLGMIGYIGFDFMRLKDSIICSIISNFVFALFLFFILLLLQKYKKIQKYQ